MSIVISRKIKQKELGRGAKVDRCIRIIVKAFKEGIFTIIKGMYLPKNSHLIKVYATTAEGHRRIVYLLDASSGDAFLLFYRSKNDKLGKNISIQNPGFRKALHSQIDVLMDDIGRQEVDVYDQAY